MAPTPPAGRMRWDRLFYVLVLLGGAAFAVYWFLLKK
jgi:hypothetical protein